MPPITRRQDLASRAAHGGVAPAAKREGGQCPPYFETPYGVTTNGFTLVEIMMVVAILGLAAAIAVPLLSDTKDVQVASASRQVVSALLFAQTASISEQTPYQIVVDNVTDSISVLDQDDAPITDDLLSQTSLQVSFPTTPNMSQVKVDSVDFDGGNRIWFDRLGAPYSGLIADNTPMNTGQIILRAGDHTVTVNVEPVTGRITLVE